MPGLLFLLLVLGVMGWIVGKGVSRFVGNERSPELTEPAAAVKKIRDSHLDPTTNVMHTTLLIVFDLGEEEIRCAVPARVCREIPAV